jgi:hypothetical protein
MFTYLWIVAKALLDPLKERALATMQRLVTHADTQPGYAEIEKA